MTNFFSDVYYGISDDDDCFYYHSWRKNVRNNVAGTFVPEIP